MNARRLVVPATALTVALGPAVVAPPWTPPSPSALPVVHADAIQLAGIGQNIYNAITPIVQTVVGDVSYLINFIPLVGGIAAAQVNINYFQGIQPTVAATVDYAAALLRAPLDFFPITRAYLDALVGIGYDLVSAQLRFLGFNELPPRPASAVAPRVAAAAVPGESPVVDSPAAVAVPDRTARPARARQARTERPALRPGAPAKSAKPAAAQSGPSAQGRDSADTRRQKSTSGRTRSAN